MRKALFVSLVFVLASIPLALCQDEPIEGSFSPEQLDNLIAPIALYPDPLLAQVLLAATFPDQVDEAARFVRASNDPNYIDQETWDVSIKAVAHYPTVVSMMADKLDWTTALGQAYVNQSTDVMESVQRLRMQARSAGNLMTTPQQQVVDDGGNIEIWPAQPQYIYVPVYDPGLVYVRRPGFAFGVSFGRGLFIGAWLNHDFDWRGHRVYYHGWDNGGGWIGRSRGFVHVNNSYVNLNFRNVMINRTVMRRNVDYNTLDRYHSVHRDVHYDNFRRNDRGRTVFNNDRRVDNKVIERNINVRDSRIDSYRGRDRDNVQTYRAEPNRPDNRQPGNRPDFNRGQPNRPDANRQPGNRPDFNRAQPNRSDNSAFGANRGGFDARAASQRGRESRTEVARPAPAARSSNPAARREDSGSRDRGKKR
jgi:hypothetical protein